MTRSHLVPLLYLFTLPLLAQAPSNCRAPALTPLAPGSSMFSAAREMELGAVLHGSMEQRERIIDDTALTSYLYKIGTRLEKNFPDSGLRFHYYIVDLPEANAFAQPGGEIYVSRKLIAFVKSEDELAGVMGHEMGHIVTHQGAIEVSRQFRDVLGIKQLSDNEDIFERYNDLLDNYARKRSAFRRTSEDEHQLAADNVAVYAISAAGYDVKSLPAFFDRFTENKGKIGNFFSDLFSATTPEQKRFRDMLKSSGSLPAECIAAREPDSAAEFKQWQSQVVSYSGIGHPEKLPNLIARKELNPPLRSELTHIRISPDGRYMLAEDPASILVLSREQLKPLFRIDAENAHGAEFSLDSKQLAFFTGGLEFGSSPRVEVWDLERQSQRSVSEIHVPRGCVQSALSRDGHYFACLSLAEIGANPDYMLRAEFDLRVIDVETGNLTIEKKNFFAADGFQILFRLILGSALGDAAPAMRIGSMNFSPDSRTFLFGRAGISVSLDAASGNKVNLPGSIRDAMQVDFSFLDDSRMVGAGKSVGKGVVVKYPTGEVLFSNLNIGASQVNGAAHGDYVVLHGFKEYPSIIFDLKQNKMLQGSKRAAMDIYDDTYIRERVDGELGIIDIKNSETLKSVQLLPGPLGGLKTSAVSDDLSTLAISGHSRGAVWDVEHGNRLALMRSFNSAALAPGYLFAEFPTEGDAKRAIGLLKLSDGSSSSADLDDSNRELVVGQYLLEWHPQKKDDFQKQVTLTVKDLHHQLKVLWTRDFPSGMPPFYTTPSLNSMLIAVDSSSEIAKSAIAASPDLKSKYDSLRDKTGAYYFEIVDPGTGKATARTVISTGKRSFRIEKAFATADRIVVSDNNSRIQVFGYDGTRQGRVLGHSAYASPDGKFLAIQTGRGKLAAYELATMKQINEFDFVSQPTVVAFDKTRPRLLVVTRDQKAYYLDLVK